MPKDYQEVEKLSEQIHHLYCFQYEKDHGKPYWTNGDYSKLDERTKEYDRNIARFILEDRTTYGNARVEEIIKIAEKQFDSFLLTDWSGEAEVYAEIDRLKADLIKAIKK